MQKRRIIPYAINLFPTSRYRLQPPEYFRLHPFPLSAPLNESREEMNFENFRASDPNATSFRNKVFCPDAEFL